MVYKSFVLGTPDSDAEDIYDCLTQPSLNLVSNHEDGVFVAKISDKDEFKVFSDENDAFIYFTDNISENKELIKGLMISVNEEDEDGMYDYINEKGGTSELIYDEKEIDSYLHGTIFCALQHADIDAIIEDETIVNDKISIDGEIVDLNDLHGYIDDDELRVCLYIK